jgi:CRP-like cAMP-binding protein
MQCAFRWPRAQILFERNIRLRFAYFVESGAVSLFAQAAADVEIRTLGASGFIGIALILGAHVSPHRCTVQVAGSALRIEVDNLVSLVDADPELHRVLLT